jgi:hypothetical protein
VRTTERRQLAAYVGRMAVIANEVNTCWQLVQRSAATLAAEDRDVATAQVCAALKVLGAVRLRLLALKPPVAASRCHERWTKALSDFHEGEYLAVRGYRLLGTEDESLDRALEWVRGASGVFDKAIEELAALAMSLSESAMDG